MPFAEPAELRAEGDPPQVDGEWSTRFAPVVACLARQLAEGRHHGVALAVEHRGQVVVDVWAGLHDGPNGPPWSERSMAVVFSAAKVIPAFVMLRELERAGLGLDTPVAEVWPTFVDRRVTMSHVLTHRAGLPHLRSLVPSAEALADWDAVVGALAVLPPWWEPGTRHGYHALSFGWLAGEVARRVADRSFPDLVADVRSQLALDGCFIGTPEDEHHRVAPVRPGGRDVQVRGGSGRRRALLEQTFPPFEDLRTFVNTSRGLSAVLPSVGGVLTARSLARIYGMLVPEADDPRRALASPAVRHLLRAPATPTRADLMMMLPTAWTHGLLHRLGSRKTGPPSFGLAGFGGSTGFADPDAKIAVGLVCTQGDDTGFGLQRSEEVIQAVYESAR